MKLIRGFDANGTALVEVSPGQVQPHELLVAESLGVEGGWPVVLGDPVGPPMPVIPAEQPKHEDKT